ncbi:hypothetical protein V501_06284 [Pseudogymnoascus sp. VKM F-4519 (FW-2642)]|nr:hypothetical protein V501_06284 [Pseudogymnoascus sp. VKM F-4519 (FW-2642)]
MATLQSQPPTSEAYLVSYPAQHVVLLTINRPKVMNCIHAQGHWDMDAFFQWFDHEPSLRVAIITGAGPKAFCAGQDLIEQGRFKVNRPPTSSMKHPPSGFAGVSRRIGKKPIIAAVNGFALGGGFEITLNCDLVVASPTASFGLPEASVGLYAAAGGLPRVVRNCGLQIASEIAMTGRRLTAEEALKYSLINRVAKSPSTVMEESLELAAKISNLSPDAIIVTRSGLREAWETGSVERATQITSDRYDYQLGTAPNMKIGLVAFAQKKKPDVNQDVARYAPHEAAEYSAPHIPGRLLVDKNAPFGVDLLIPQVGGNARKTNVDYAKGKLNELIDVIIEGGAKVFVCAVGVPPKAVVEKLHKAGVLYANMVGHPKHAHKACQIGADIIVAQGGEAGGHTGDIPFSVLIPAVADAIKSYRSPLTGQPVYLAAGGGVFDGRSLAAALMLGASAVWVGTRFVASKESGASEHNKKTLVQAGFDQVIKTTIFTGRPVRHYATPYIKNWEENRQEEIKELLGKGIVPLQWELEKYDKEGKSTEEIEDQTTFMPMGYVGGLVTQLNQPAGDIVREMVDQAYELLRSPTGEDI